MVNVGKYTIHESYGSWYPFWTVPRSLQIFFITTSLLGVFRWFSQPLSLDQKSGDPPLPPTFQTCQGGTNLGCDLLVLVFNRTWKIPELQSQKMKCFPWMKKKPVDLCLGRKMWKKYDQFGCIYKRILRNIYIYKILEDIYMTYISVVFLFVFCEIAHILSLVS